MKKGLFLVVFASLVLQATSTMPFGWLTKLVNSTKKSFKVVNSQFKTKAINNANKFTKDAFNWGLRNKTSLIYGAGATVASVGILNYYKNYKIQKMVNEIKYEKMTEKINYSLTKFSFTKSSCRKLGDNEKYIISAYSKDRKLAGQIGITFRNDGITLIDKLDIEPEYIDQGIDTSLIYITSNLISKKMGSKSIHLLWWTQNDLASTDPLVEFYKTFGYVSSEVDDRMYGNIMSKTEQNNYKIQESLESKIKPELLEKIEKEIN